MANRLQQINQLPVVSIVVPVYNVERYLEQCIRSICAQTLENIEIILVDDGSKDCSGALADELALTDSRIRVIHQANAGLGPARNTGIDAARGEYIGFVDSDDWIEPDMFRALWQSAAHTGADICATGLKTMTGGKEVDVFVQPLAGKALRGAEEIDSYRLDFYGLPDDSEGLQPLVSVCLRLYRRQLLDSMNLRFKAIRSEDIDFNIRAMREAACIAFVPGTHYCYRKDNQPSITSASGCKIIGQYERFVSACADCIEGERLEVVTECRRRLQRGVFGYMRTLVDFCVASGVRGGELVSFTKAVLRSPVFSPYLKDYPKSGMSVERDLILRLMRGGMAKAVVLLFGLRRRLRP